MKRILLCLLLGTVILTSTACGKSGDDNTENNNGGKAVETEYGTVTFGDYSNLTADEVVYDFSEADIDSEIENMLYEYAEYSEKSTAEMGDNVEVFLYATSDGAVVFDYTENGDGSYVIELGYEEFGPEFDEQLIGVSAGDVLNFSVTYDEDYDNISLAGGMINYEVTVLSVQEEKIPELTDSFVQENLGYDSVAEFRTSVEENLNSYYNSDSSYYTKESLLQQVIDGAEFGDYTEELYQSAKASVDASYEGYIDWLGVNSVDEVYESLEMSDEDVESEIMAQVYRIIAINGLAQEQKLELTDDEYQAGAQMYTDLYADYYEDDYTQEDLLSEFGEDNLRYWILEDKVLDYLYENATITKVQGNLDDM